MFTRTFFLLLEHFECELPQTVIQCRLVSGIALVIA